MAHQLHKYITLHILRSGACTSYAYQGYSDSQKKSFGKWIFEAFKTYIGPWGINVISAMINSPLSKVLDHQVAADVKGDDFLSNFPYILIIFKW